MHNVTSLSSSSPVPATLLGIAGLRVHEVWELFDERHLLVDSPPGTGVCTGCGQRAESKGRATVHLRDLPAAAKATRLVWVKRIWRCHDCGVSWRERHPELPSRSVLTARARVEAARQVGEEGRAVAAVARDFGVGWETIMRAVTDEARARFADQDIFTIQRRPCLAIGVDEKVMNRGRRALRRRRKFVTVIVDLARGVPLDIVEGRSKKVLKAWLAAQDPAWRAGVKIAALDPAAPYRAALTDPKVGLLNAQLVLDRFHAEKLAGAAVDDCRRRVQQETTGHRGRAGDDLYETRKLLLMASERLDDDGAAQLQAALAAGDPYEEVGCTHMAKELLRGVYLSPDIFTARIALERFFEWAPRSMSLRSPGWPRPSTAGVSSCWPTSAPTAPPPGRSKPSTARSNRSTAPPIGASATSTTTGSGCCSRPPSPGTLPPPQDSGAAADNQTPLPPRSSRRAGIAA